MTTPQQLFTADYRREQPTETPGLDLLHNGPRHAM